MPESGAILVPQMNVNDDQAVIVAWQVPCGAHVEPGRAIATLETTKATFDVHADRAGYVLYSHEAKSIVAVGSILAWVSEDRNASVEQLAGAALSAPQPAETSDARFTRKALRRMQQLGVSAAELPSAGRIEVADVERVALARAAGVSGPLQAPASTPAQQNAIDTSRLYRALEQSSSKIMEAARLSEVYRAIVPSMVTVPVSAQRMQKNLAELAEAGGPVSLLELAIREVAGVLAEYPELNGFFAAGRAWTYRDVAVGFAVNAGKSLRVPVVRDAARLSQLEVCRAVRDLTLRYFRDELSMADVSGGTFTITDLSGHGVTHFVPVLNDRQAAILGICAPDPNMAYQNLVLAFDHRMSDGMRAAAFLGELREGLEA